MKNKKGFTLAEIIIAMTIISVIAAITIPALLVSTNEKTMEAQKRALHARLAQAVSQIDDMRIYGKSSSGNDKSSALNFITKSLSKTYKIIKTCDKNSLSLTCDFPEEIMTSEGDIFKISNYTSLSSFLGVSPSALVLNTDVAGFITANNESMAIFYNPNCRGESSNGFYSGSALNAMCLNIIYDLNGQDKAPNEVGKDIGFISVFFPKDSDIAAPVPSDSDITTTFTNYSTAIEACKDQNNSLIIPNWKDGMSMALNKRLTGMADDTYLVTGAGSTSAYKMDVSTLMPSSATDFSGLKLRCVYNN